MKVQIRTGVFETNSSSTHAIAIENQWHSSILRLHHMDVDKIEDEKTKERLNKYPFPESVTFNPGEFGWEEATYTDCNSKASYLITAMLNLLEYDEFDEKIKTFKKWLSDEGIEMVIPEYEKELDTYHSTDKYKIYNVNMRCGNNDYFYIDHVDEADEFMCYVIATKEHLFSYLFGDSIVKTGNDNNESDISFFEERKDERGYTINNAPATIEGWEFLWSHKIFRKGN